MLLDRKKWKGPRRLLLLVAAVALCLALPSCAVAGVVTNMEIRTPGAEEAFPPGEELVRIEDEAVPLAGSVVRTPSTGSVQYQENGAVIDASNTSSGYVMCAYSGSGKIKVLVNRSGGATYSYNLNTNGTFEVFPLTSGDGTYTVGIYQNVSGNQYATLISKTISVSLSSSVMPFLYPNQYVNFNANSTTVQTGAALAQGATDDLTVVTNVYNYVISNISYDTAKANSVQSGYVPAVDSILASGKGICFDYASVMATMLRSQNIPTRVEVGYVSGGLYHAWISVYTNELGWVNNIIQFDGQSWKLMDPTFASSANQSSDIMAYIGNGSNYSVQYLY